MFASFTIYSEIFRCELTQFCSEIPDILVNDDDRIIFSGDYTFYTLLKDLVSSSLVSLCKNAEALRPLKEGDAWRLLNSKKEPSTWKESVPVIDLSAMMLVISSVDISTFFLTAVSPQDQHNNRHPQLVTCQEFDAHVGTYEQVAQELFDAQNKQQEALTANEKRLHFVTKRVESNDLALEMLTDEVTTVIETVRALSSRSNLCSCARAAHTRRNDEETLDFRPDFTLSESISSSLNRQERGIYRSMAATEAQALKCDADEGPIPSHGQQPAKGALGGTYKLMTTAEAQTVNCDAGEGTIPCHGKQTKESPRSDRVATDAHALFPCGSDDDNDDGRNGVAPSLSLSINTPAHPQPIVNPLAHEVGHNGSIACNTPKHNHDTETDVDVCHSSPWNEDYATLELCGASLADEISRSCMLIQEDSTINARGVTSTPRDSDADWALPQSYNRRLTRIMQKLTITSFSSYRTFWPADAIFARRKQFFLDPAATSMRKGELLKCRLYFMARAFATVETFERNWISRKARRSMELLLRIFDWAVCTRRHIDPIISHSLLTLWVLLLAMVGLLLRWCSRTAIKLPSSSLGEGYAIDSDIYVL